MSKSYTELEPLAARLKMHPQALLRLCRLGKFPKPIKLGGVNGKNIFDDAIIDEHLTRLQAEADALAVTPPAA